MAEIVERLPFKLARPNPNTGVTDADAIDMEGKSLDRAVPSNRDNADNASDFDISDERGNVLVQFADGGIQTKDFDSKKTPKQGKSASDFDIRDSQGNVLVQFANGHIKTQKFDSENIEPSPSPSPTPTPSTGFTLTQIY